MQLILKKSLWTALNRSGVDRLVNHRYGGQGVVLLMHSVVPKPSEHLNADIVVSTQFLHDCVTWLRAHGYEIIPITELLDRLGRTDAGPFAVLTFDDGYRDNLVHAFPLLDSLHVPFTVYVSTDVLTRSLHAWWLGLKELFLTRDRVDFDERGVVFNCVRLEEKAAALESMVAWVQQDHTRIAGLVQTFSKYGVDIAGLLDRDGLSASEVRRMAASSLVTVGGHTTSHRALSSLPTDVAYREIEDNRTFLEDLIEDDVRHFAYPFGGAGECGVREAGLAKLAGFETAVTTRRGLVFNEHKDNPMAIPRIGFSCRDSVRSLACKVRGVSVIVASRCGDPIVFM